MTAVTGNGTNKLITYECGCAIRLYRGDVARTNLCQEHWDILNKMEGKD